ncbi:RNA-directed DNA polymerase, eukaryota, reverse transcriptase zinc-binding domain protein [Tanacetum coccineum]|uniref:RNA-directed DNA polymerase, eukaryota, reverse transcriptase zinc-binding domain protein n=1 Tax=Tanacetum coccineum TaxID=301880 RepID=A0ABQ5B4D2_9ASTR
MGDRRSKEDDVRKISTSIFVTNFPEQRSKSGYRFGFVRFIKIKGVDRLVSNLCTIWVGRFHANIARFQRVPLNNVSSQVNSKVGKSTVPGDSHNQTGVHGHSNSFVQAVKMGHQSHTVVEDQKPALVLDDSCNLYMDLSLSVVGKIKEFASLPNIKNILAAEGFDDIDIRYMGGFWVLFQFVSNIKKDKFLAHVGVGSWFTKLQHASSNFKLDERVTWIDIEGVPLCVWSHNTFVRIASKWGSLLHDEDEEAPFFHRKRLCIKTTSEDIIFESFKIIFKGKNFWIRAKEVTGWTPNFNECEDDFTDSDNESSGVNNEETKNKAISDVDSEVEEIPETIFEQGVQGGIKSNAASEKPNEVLEEVHSSEPFNIYELLNKKNFATNETQQPEGEPKYPPGFTPHDVSEVNSNMEHNSKGKDFESNQNNHEKVNELKIKKKASKIISKEDIEVSVCSGHLKSVGIPKSGGSILQVIKDLINVGQTMGYKMDGCINNFEEIVKNQGAQEWKSDGIVMDNFNEVRSQEERFGSILIAQGAAAFNNFISLGGLVEVSSRDINILDPNPMSRLLKKLRHLKKEIRLWVKDNNNKNRNQKKSLKIMLVDIDSSLDKGDVSFDNLEKRMNIKHELTVLKNMDSLELDQKAKIKWSIEGDENSKYFHGIINKQKSNLVIRGILVDGTWIEDPTNVKNEFLTHFKDRFNRPCDSSFIALILKTQDAKFVKDFRPISQIGSLYKIIAKILTNRSVCVLGNLVNEVQSAFIENRQILDGPFILNELIHWCKAKKKQTMIFKVNFEKAFDYVRWDFLDDVLKMFGFGDRWCAWIQSCLRSSRGSIIVNGSPTSEFQFHKGLKQRDPLSPFLFILVMESLHLSFQKVVNAGLRINMQKSKIMGVAMENSKVTRAAANIGCMTLKAPFNYLGVKVGGRMTRINSWDEIINKLLCRLSKWKMKTLSIGGRLTLLKSVLGSMPIYYMSMFKVPLQVLKKMESIRSYFFNGVELFDKKMSLVKWDNVLVSKEKEGLGISSFFALNCALIFKWVWRFSSQKSSLWSRVIKAIHGMDGKLGCLQKACYSSNWIDIIREVSLLHNKGMDLLGFTKKKMGNGENTLFWEDSWKDGVPFKSLYPRLYALESDKKVTVATRVAQSDLCSSLRRMPRGGVKQQQLSDLCNGEFSIASVRNFIDDHIIMVAAPKTRWIKTVPKKINILAWRVKMNNLPTRFNLSRRGMDLASIFCSTCNVAAETTSHIFFDCSMVKEIYNSIASWWDINILEMSSYEDWWDWLMTLHLPVKLKMFLEGVFYITWWLIWNFRNSSIFSSNPPSKYRILDDIVARSFSWCRSRCNSNFSWLD